MVSEGLNDIMPRPQRDPSLYNGAPGTQSGAASQQHGDSTPHRQLPACVPQPSEQRKPTHGFAFGVVPRTVVSMYFQRDALTSSDTLPQPGSLLMLMALEGIVAEINVSTEIIHVDDSSRAQSRTYPLGSKLVVFSDLYEFTKSRSAEFLQWLSIRDSETGVARHPPTAAPVITQARIGLERESSPSQPSDGFQPSSAQHTNASVLPVCGNQGSLKRSAAEADLDAVDPSTDVEQSGNNSSTAALVSRDSAASVSKRVKHSSLTKSGSRTGVPGKRQDYRHHKFPETILPQGISAFDIVDHHPYHLKGQVLDNIITSGDMSAGDVAKRLTQNGHPSDRTNVYNKWKTYWKKTHPGATAAEFEQARKSARAAWRTQAKIGLRQRHRRPDPSVGPALAALGPGQVHQHGAVLAPNAASQDSVFRDRDENGDLDGIHEVVDDSHGTISGYHPSDHGHSESNSNTNHAPLRFRFGGGIRAPEHGNPYITNGEVMPHENYVSSNASAYPKGSDYAPVSNAPLSQTLLTYGPANYSPAPHPPASDATASSAAVSLTAFSPNRPFVRPGEQHLHLTSESQPPRRSPVVAFTGLQATTISEAEGDPVYDTAEFENNEFDHLHDFADTVTRAERLPAAYGAIYTNSWGAEAFHDHTSQTENGEGDEEDVC